jgi:ABC-type Mn2+/Zn2+ transport system permease subunit
MNFQDFIDDFPVIRDPFLASIILAVVLSFLGVHVILRRVVFVGIALSEMSSLGIATSFFVEGFAWTGPGSALRFTRDHLTMGTIFNLVGLAFLTAGESKRLSREARIAICFAAAGALAILLVSGSDHAMDEIRAIMVHDPLFISHQDLKVVFITMLPSLGLLMIFFRRFLLVGYDREIAQSLGIRTRHWDSFFYLLLGLAIAMAIHLSGVLFAIGFLVLPGATALGLARSPWPIFCIAMAAGAVAAVIGFIAGHMGNLALGPTTVTTAFALFIVSRSAAALLRRRT